MTLEPLEARAAPVALLVNSPMLSALASALRAPTRPDAFDARVDTAAAPRTGRGMLSILPPSRATSEETPSPSAAKRPAQVAAKTADPPRLHSIIDAAPRASRLGFNIDTDLAAGVFFASRGDEPADAGPRFDTSSMFGRQVSSLAGDGPVYFHIGISSSSQSGGGGSGGSSSFDSSADAESSSLQSSSAQTFLFAPPANTVDGASTAPAVDPATPIVASDPVYADLATAMGDVPAGLTYGDVAFTIDDANAAAVLKIDTGFDPVEGLRAALRMADGMTDPPTGMQEFQVSLHVGQDVVATYQVAVLFPDNRMVDAIHADRAQEAQTIIAGQAAQDAAQLLALLDADGTFSDQSTAETAAATTEGSSDAASADRLDTNLDRFAALAGALAADTTQSISTTDRLSVYAGITKLAAGVEAVGSASADAANQSATDPSAADAAADRAHRLGALAYALSDRMTADMAGTDPALAQAAQDAWVAAYTGSDLYFRGWTGKGVNSDLYRTERADLGDVQYALWYESGAAQLTDQFTVDLGRTALVQVSVSLDGISSGGLRTAPLVVDSVTIDATASTYVNEVFAGTSYDSETSMYVANVGGSEKESFVKYDLTGAGLSQHVAAATMSLYATPVTDSPEIEAKAIPDGSWNAATLTWTNSRSLSAGNAVATFPTPASAGWVDVDVTEAVRRELRVGDMDFSGGLSSVIADIADDIHAFADYLRDPDEFEQQYADGTTIDNDILYRGDANFDGAVSLGDFVPFLKRHGKIQADYTLDGFVDIFDINRASANWESNPEDLSTYTEGDGNLDADIDIFDVNLVSANWSPGGWTPLSVAVPTLSLQLYSTTSGEVQFTSNDSATDKPKLTINRTPDLIIKDFSSDGTDLSVTYLITHDDVTEPEGFTIGVYRSYDGQSLDAGMMTFEVDDQTPVTGGGALTPGLHTVTIPVTQEFADNDVVDDYYLAALLDDGEAHDESDETNNAMLLDGGVFQDAAGNVHVHGKDTADSVAIDTDEITVSSLSPSAYQIAVASAASVRVRAHAGDDDVSTYPAVDTPLFLFGGDGADTLQGGAVHDEIFGGPGVDELFGMAGDDLLYGDEDVDILDGGDGNDYLDGGAGDDDLAGGAGSDYLTGGDGDDLLLGEDGDDVLYGEAGGDILFGGSGDDYLNGGDGSDRLYGDSGENWIEGENGEDELGYDPPQFIGTSSFTVDEDAANTVIDLTEDFIDAYTEPEFLIFDLIQDIDEPLFSLVTLDGVSGTLIVDYAPDTFGQAELTVSATDSDGDRIEATYSFVVNSVNDAPTTAGLFDLEVDEGTPDVEVSLLDVFDDLEDGANLSFSHSVSGDVDLVESISIVDGTLSLELAPNEHGSLDITITATDSENASEDSTFTLTVNRVNNAPVLNPLPQASPSYAATINEHGDAYLLHPYAYTIAGVLEWESNADLDLYAKLHETVVWFGSTSGEGLSLNHDAHPNGTSEPLAPEIISGCFTTQEEFLWWYNLHSEFGGTDSPWRHEVIVANIGINELFVNGETVEPGDTFTVNPIEFVGEQGQQDDYEYGTAVSVTFSGQPEEPLIEVSASDSDEEDSLTFQLVEGPPGASLTQTGPTTAAISYPFSLEEAGATLRFLVRVTDDGDPSLHDEQEYYVVVPDPECHGEEENNSTPVAHDDQYQVAPDGTLVASGAGVLANDYDQDGDQLQIYDWTSPAHSSTFTLNSDGSFTYIPVTGFVGVDTFTYSVTDGEKQSNAAQVTVQVNAPPELLARIIKDVADSSEFNTPSTGNEWLPETQKEGNVASGKGMYLPIDKDDDDNNGHLDRDNNGTAGGVGPPPLTDNDLAEIAIRRVAGSTGAYRLQIPSAIRVWKKTSQGYERIQSNTDLTFENPQDTLMTLYVQGVGATGAGGQALGVRWFDPMQNQLVVADQLTVHTFDIRGPANVPDFAIYEYVARGGAGGQLSAFVTPSKGTENSNTPGTTDDKAAVLWGQGAVFGKVRYAASPNYTWAFDVAIVKVELDLTTAGATTIATETNAANKPVQGTVPLRRRRLDSTTERSGPNERNIPYGQNLPADRAFLNEPAMKLQVTIKRMEGPTRQVDGQNKMFGVSHIEVGVVQSLEFTDYRAVTAAGDVPIKERTPGPPQGAPLQDLKGQTMLDVINQKPRPTATYATVFNAGTRQPVPVTEPWYDATGLTGGGAASKGLFRPTQDAPVDNTLMRIADTPSGNGVDFTLIPVPGVLGARQITGYKMIFDFTDYVAVRTVDRDNSADKVYTQRAFAAWQFDGSGTFDNNGVYTFEKPMPLRPPEQFVEKQDGARLPQTLMRPGRKIVNEKLR